MKKEDQENIFIYYVDYVEIVIIIWNIIIRGRNCRGQNAYLVCLFIVYFERSLILFFVHVTSVLIDT